MCRAGCRTSLMPMPPAPRSPRPRMRSPSVTTTSEMPRSPAGHAASFCATLRVHRCAQTGRGRNAGCTGSVEVELGSRGLPGSPAANDRTAAAAAAECIYELRASVQRRAHRTAPHRRQSRIVHVSQIVGRNIPCRPGPRSACRPMAAAAECAQRAVGKTRPRRRPAVAAGLHIGQYLSVVLVTLSVQRLVRGRAAASRPEIVSSFVERAGLLAHSARSEKQHYCTNFNL